MITYEYIDKLTLTQIHTVRDECQKKAFLQIPSMVNKQKTIKIWEDSPNKEWGQTSFDLPNKPKGLCMEYLLTSFLSNILQFNIEYVNKESQSDRLINGILSEIKVGVRNNRKGLTINQVRPKSLYDILIAVGISAYKKEWDWLIMTKDETLQEIINGHMGKRGQHDSHGETRAFRWNIDNIKKWTFQYQYNTKDFLKKCIDVFS